MLSKETLLRYVTQEQIMSRYFPMGVSFRRTYINPFRRDKDPGCTFRYSKSGILYFTDWAKGTSLDCFQVASLSLNESNFQRVLRLIDKDLNLGIIPTSLKIPSKTHFKPIRDTINVETIKESKLDKKGVYIEFNEEFSKTELEWWARYYITIDDLTLFNIRSVKRMWFDESSYIESTIVSPIYHYLTDYSSGDYQIYCPNRPTRFYSFIEPYSLMGLDQLPWFGDILFITSSYKDVIALYKIGINAVCPCGESTPIVEETLRMLSKRFKQLYINYNNDDVGMKATNILIENHPYIDFKIVLNSLKDPSDVLYSNGLIELKNEVFNQL
jgi:hypothetical protein